MKCWISFLFLVFVIWVIGWCLCFWFGSVGWWRVWCGRSWGYFWCFWLLFLFCVVGVMFVVCCLDFLFWLWVFWFSCLVWVWVDVGFWLCWCFYVGLVLGSVWYVIVGRCMVSVCWCDCWLLFFLFCIMLVFVLSWLRRSMWSCGFCRMIVGWSWDLWIWICVFLGLVFWLEFLVVCWCWGYIGELVGFLFCCLFVGFEFVCISCCWWSCVLCWLWMWMMCWFIDICCGLVFLLFFCSWMYVLVLYFCYMVNGWVCVVLLGWCNVCCWCCENFFIWCIWYDWSSCWYFGWMLFFLLIFCWRMLCLLSWWMVCVL